MIKDILAKIRNSIKYRSKLIDMGKDKIDTGRRKGIENDPINVN
jgi:hypothetical protein